MDELEVQLKEIAKNVAETKAKADQVAEVSIKAGEAKLTAIEAKQAAENAAKEAKEATTTITSIKEWQVGKDERDKENQKALNDILASQKQMQLSQAGNLKSFEGEIEEILTN
jgi:hypothetical protein